MIALVVMLVGAAWFVDRFTRRWATVPRACELRRDYREAGTGRMAHRVADAAEAAEVLSRADAFMNLEVVATGEHITMQRTDKGWRIHDPAGDFARAIGRLGIG